MLKILKKILQVFLKKEKNFLYFQSPKKTTYKEKN